MIYIDYSEYKEWDKNTKLEKLNTLWNTDKSVLKGRIGKIDLGKQYFFINDIRNLDDDNIENPFEIEDIDYVYCKTQDIDTINKIFKYNDEVVFQFDVQSNNKPEQDKDSEKNKPIVADEKSIKLLYDFKSLLDIFENINLKDIIFNEYSKKSVVFCEDIESLFYDENKKILEEITSNYELVEKLNNDINYKKNEISDLTSMFDEEFVNEKKRVDIDLEKIRKEKFSEIDFEINKKRTEIKKLEELAKKYDAFGFDTNFNTIKKPSEIEYDDANLDKKEQAEYIQKYLGVRKNKGLFYDKYIIEMFLSALCTNQIIILCGKPGSGKSSLVEGFSEAISAECKMVSVQPNWTDNQDLLGFYNPIEKTYVSTPFLDTIIDAKFNPNKLYVICLDEMNLAHVEYYFSEFLSKLQSKNRIIELYSKYIYEETKKEINQKINKLIKKNIDIDDSLTISEFFSTFSEEEIQEHYKIKWQWNMLTRYPSSIEIPDNIRFVGTINKDETTKDISPKVVDRSFVIELNKYSKETENDIKLNIEKYKEKYSKNLNLSSSNFTIERNIVDSEFSKKLDDIKKVLEGFNVYLNNRFDDQVEQIIGSKIIKNNNELFDYIVSCMILPKIKLNIENNDDKNVSLLKAKLKETLISKEIFYKMEKYYTQEHILTYWR
ncbi:McrB family protein [Sedimentibacter sp. B4]|uniref:McrB family protein n=1 Tax=Sedimentibacter sp. B4 TaxID=304766 RepID=UPI0002D98556|nr:AAA family ATPase [Sedimentibacter sp. B4]